MSRRRGAKSISGVSLHKKGECSRNASAMAKAGIRPRLSTATERKRAMKSTMVPAPSGYSYLTDLKVLDLQKDLPRKIDVRNGVSVILHPPLSIGAKPIASKLGYCRMP